MRSSQSAFSISSLLSLDLTPSVFLNLRIPLPAFLKHQILPEKYCLHCCSLSFQPQGKLCLRLLWPLSLCSRQAFLQCPRCPIRSAGILPHSIFSIYFLWNLLPLRWNRPLLIRLLFHRHSALLSLQQPWP